MPPSGDDRTTKQRLVDEAMRLFADRGFRGTTVGDIEDAAGLAARAGGFYRHFANKRDVLQAGVERHMNDVRSMGDVIDLLPLGDVRSELTLLVRWLLNELSRERDVCRVIEKEGERFPELVELMWERVIRQGYADAAEFARRRLKGLELADAVDVDALAAIAVSAVVNYRRTEWTFGHPPGDIDEERFVATFVEMFVLLFERGAGRA